MRKGRGWNTNRTDITIQARNTSISAQLRYAGLRKSSVKACQVNVVSRDIDTRGIIYTMQNSDLVNSKIYKIEYFWKILLPDGTDY